MKWFDKWMYKQTKKAWENKNRFEMEEEAVLVGAKQRAIGSQVLLKESESVESDPVLNFKVYSAIGGRIVEFRKYDRNRDRNETQTYIITNDQDFGERIAKIATMENLKT
jgi:hypothetical protein